MVRRCQEIQSVAEIMDDGAAIVNYCEHVEAPT